MQIIRMKKISLIVSILLLQQMVSHACSVCEKRQPKIARGITHGVGPESDWDYLIIGITAFIVVISLIFSVKWLLNPAEDEASHIKRSRFILE